MNEIEVDRQVLEGLIDRNGLSGTLADLVAVCYEKAEHLRANWQDEEAAKAWERHASRIEGLARRIAR